MITEEAAKVIAAVWGNITYSISCRASCFAPDEIKKRLIPPILHIFLVQPLPSLLYMYLSFFYSMQMANRKGRFKINQTIMKCGMHAKLNKKLNKNVRKTTSRTERVGRVILRKLKGLLMMLLSLRKIWLMFLLLILSRMSPWVRDLIFMSDTGLNNMFKRWS